MSLSPVCDALVGPQLAIYHGKNLPAQYYTNRVLGEMIAEGKVHMGIEVVVFILIALVFLLVLGQAGGTTPPQTQPSYPPAGWPPVYMPPEPQGNGCVSLLFGLLAGVIAFALLVLLFLR